MPLPALCVECESRPQGLTFKEVAEKRKIQIHTVAAYLADAIVSGHGYFWPACTVSSAEMELMQKSVAGILNVEGKN